MGKAKFDKNKYNRMYYQLNRVKLIGSQQKYYQIHRARVLTRMKQRLQTDPAHREMVRQNSEDWREKFPLKQKKSSHNSYTSRRRKNRDYLDAKKESVPCIDCNIFFPAVCMDFDHRPGEIKRAALSEMVSSYAFESLDTEITKCDIVCACCHRIRTQKRRAKKL